MATPCAHLTARATRLRAVVAGIAATVTLVLGCTSPHLAIGSSGVPETFVVDGRGIIRYQHIGPIENSDVPTIMARLEEAK